MRMFSGSVLAACSLMALLGSAASAETTKTYRVAGLTAPAEIIVDRWGVPHLYASETYDAFFVQGFNAARDRLWQIDLWRKRGLGELARDFGPAYLEQDRMARQFLYRGDMYREWLAYGSDAKKIAQRFHRRRQRLRHPDPRRTRPCCRWNSSCWAISRLSGAPRMSSASAVTA